MKFVFSYTPKDSTMTSETYHYQKGANQLFSQPTHLFDPSQFSDEELSYNPDKEIIPIAIHCVAQDGPDGNFIVYSFYRLFDCSVYLLFTNYREICNKCIVMTWFS